MSEACQASQGRAANREETKRLRPSSEWAQLMPIPETAKVKQQSTSMQINQFVCRSMLSFKTSALQRNSPISLSRLQWVIVWPAAFLLLTFKKGTMPDHLLLTSKSSQPKLALPWPPWS